MKLYICGNGFDRHHNLETAYSDYGEFLSNNYPDIYKGYENFLFLNNSAYPNNKWTDIESSLTIDYSSLLEEAIDHFYPSLDSDTDSVWDEMWISILEQTKFINDFTGEAFLRWISSIDVKHTIPKLKLNPNDLYVTFNFTDTLCQIYSIPYEHILHIHGSINNILSNDMISNNIIPSFHNIEEAELLQNKIINRNENNNYIVRKELQFGSPYLSPIAIKNELSHKYKEDEFYGASIHQAIMTLTDFIEKSTKNPKNNYYTLESFINKKEINEVIIMGHSFDGVDKQYYDDILIPKFRNIKWTFMCHKSTKKAQQFIHNNDIKQFKIINW